MLLGLFSLFLSVDDELERGHHAPVPSGSAQDSAPHPATLLRFQGHLGLDHSVSHVLHGDNGTVQRRLQE